MASSTVRRDWSWRWNDIPFFPDGFVFDDGTCGTFSAPGQPLALPEAVFKQERHDTLHKIIRSLAARGVPLDAALAVCRLENLTRCRPPLADNPLDKDIDRTR